MATVNQAEGLRLDTAVSGLVLRELTAADAALISDLRRRNVEYHERFNLGHPPEDEASIVAWIDGSIQLDFGLWLGTELVGICDLGFWQETASGLTPVRVNSAGELVAGVGYVIDEAHANRGLTTSAVNAMLEYAFSIESVTHVRSRAMTQNVASCRVLEKTGFSLVSRDDVWSVYELWR